MQLAEFYSDYQKPVGAIEEDRKLLVDLCSRFGFRHMTYAGINLCTFYKKDRYVVTTYLPAWVQYYIDQDFEDVDPVISLGISSILPFDWQDISGNKKAARMFFGEAKNAGITGQGISIPIRGAKGELAIFSFNFEIDRIGWESYKRDNISDLTYFSYLYHQDMVEALSDEHFTPPKLSPRELQVVKLTGAGNTAWEAGRILGLSERTVEFYLQNAGAKLGTVTKPQTVARAIRLGMIA